MGRYRTKGLTAGVELRNEDGVSWAGAVARSRVATASTDVNAVRIDAAFEVGEHCKRR